jgi:tetratricopeptide (TPR) repeat protein
LNDLWREGKHEEILKALIDHPYVFNQADTAFARAMCCEALGDYRAAALFFADAHRWAPNDPLPLVALGPRPFHLLDEGNLEEAWRYAQVQVERFPNAVSHSVASIVLYHKGRVATLAEQAVLFAEQSRLFELARRDFTSLPDKLRSNSELRAVILFGFEATTYAQEFQGRSTEAHATAEEATRFAPDSSIAWTLRGLSANEGHEKEAWFRKAIELGDLSMIPHAYLAYHAINRKDYVQARDVSRATLNLGTEGPAELKSLLYQWLAISLANLGAPRQEIGENFKRALDSAPDNVYAIENYRRFLSSEPSESSEPPPFQVAPAYPAGRVTYKFDSKKTRDQIEKKFLVTAG